METLTPPVEDVEWIAVDDSSAAGRVRRVAMQVAQRLGFTEHRAGEVGIAATELSTNLHRHAVRGSVVVRIRRNADQAAVELVAIDAGPGIANLPEIAVDGHSTRGTLGIGLGAVIRLATWFDGHSVPGRGTVMLGTFWPAEAPVARPLFGALTRPMTGETVCGDAWAVRVRGALTDVLLVDGLGHGELAALAARTAVRTFADAPDEGPTALLKRLGTALHGTRGAAAAVVRLDPGAGSLTFAGVGNIAVWIDGGEQRRALLSAPGIVGGATRTIREFDYDLPRDALVVLHSDGLTPKWDLAGYPGLRVRDPHLVAATLLRDAGLRHDDASVVVAKAS